MQPLELTFAVTFVRLGAVMLVVVVDDGHFVTKRQLFLHLELNEV